MPRIFIDMDGTAAKWNEEISSEEELLEPGYFRNRLPEDNIIEAARILTEQGNDVYILSCCLNDTYIVRDKDRWCDEHVPFIPPDHRILVPYSKDKAQYIEGGIGREDLLIDDHTPNLKEWEKNGGTAIKFLNGINWKHRTWTGPVLHADTPPFMMSREISEYMKNEKTIGNQERHRQPDGRRSLPRER